jgi:hypothetical protein
MLRKASVPAPQPTQTTGRIVFDYDRQIQPILDKHCVSCHKPGENKNAKNVALDLSGKATGVYSVSYNNLTRLGQQHQLLGNRKYRDEDAGSNNIEYIPPYQTGALTSPLAALVFGWEKTSWENSQVNAYTAKLSSTHAKANIKLSDAEKLTLVNWLDVNAPFHPSYWGKKNAKFKDDPAYRPALSFEEICGRAVPIILAATADKK